MGAVMANFDSEHEISTPVRPAAHTLGGRLGLLVVPGHWRWNFVKITNIDQRSARW